MNGEADSSKSTGANNSNPKNNKTENFSNGVIDNGRGRDRDRKEVKGAESLRVPKTESLICETLDHSSVQVEIDVQSEFDMDYSSSNQLSEVPVEYEQPAFSLTKKIKMDDTRQVRAAAAAEPEPAEGVAARGRVRVRGVGQREAATFRGRARRSGRLARQRSPSPPPPDSAPAAEPEDEAEMEEEEVQVVEEEVPIQGNAAKDRISVTKPGTLNYRARTKHQRLVPDEASSLELSSTSVAQSISSVPSPTLAESQLSAVVNCSTGEVAKQSSDAKVLPLVPVLKTSACDGYNWRKYGQKQVKIPQGSRSYYRCTHFECCAKKIECSDHTNRVTEIIYRSQHNHDPPLRENCSRESKSAVLSAPTNGKSVIAHPNRNSNDTVASSLKKNLPVAETANQDSVGSDTDTEITIKEEHSDEPEQKKRSRKSDTICSESVSKPGKKPKLVVHAACDVGISSDGYRWRKYGQKMVKGNPHPRNYYRCTSAGCPVRKHIERAVDCTSALTITYKGVHDHDMPVPKRRHGPPSASLIATASPASLTNMRAKKPLSLPHQKSTTQWSVDKEGELTGEKLDLGEQKAMESARTLLSIGFEIKPC